ncbi:MAG: bacterial Ig-like domain-containing protein, partial [Bacilli bacterium]|nr:bacterial Ig-like domain-containing protein [Bacilli bacterium]
MKNRLFVLAVSAMLLASCGAPSAEGSSSLAPGKSSEEPTSSVAPTPSSTDAPTPSSSLAEKVLTEITLDTSSVKKNYLINPLLPEDWADELDTSGLKVIAHYDDNTTEELTKNKYTVAAVDLKTAGEKEVKVTYKDKEAKYSVAVGSYKATAADIAIVNEKVVVTISGVYSGISDAAFKAFAWSADFQENGYNNGGWDGGWAEKANETVVMSAENGAFSYTRDVTELGNYLYTGHFGHKLVPNNNNGFQNMDLKIDAAENSEKSVTLNGHVYTINYNKGETSPTACWGNLGLLIADEGAPVWSVNSLSLVSDGGKTYFEGKIGFENYTNEEFLALNWYIDFQNNDNYGGGGWATVIKKENLSESMTIDGSVATFRIDVTALAAGGYTMHFGVKTGDSAPEYKPSAWTAQEATPNGDKSYHLVCYPNSGAGNEFWGCVGLVVVEENPATASIVNANVHEAEGKAVLALSGNGENLKAGLFSLDLQNTTDWTYPSISSSESIDGNNWTLTAEIPSDLAAANYVVHWFLGTASHD